LVQVIADFWLEHLQQVFKKFAKTDDRLIVARDGVKIAEVLAVEGTEDVVTLFLFLTNVAERT
jgi:hypothetical protein